MSQRILRIASFALLSLVGQTVYGDDNFILRAPPALAPAIASRHGLVIKDSPNVEGVSLLTKSDTRTDQAVLTEVSGDPDVQSIEVDQNALISETVSGIQLNQSTAAILDALSGQTLVPYYGGNVWSAYASQTATALTRLPSVQNIPATGTGIVAVIDTGVDPAQPVLQGSLVPGYDFVNGVAGLASEWSDVDPTTAGLLSTGAANAQSVPTQLNQSTAAILDQSTAAILDTSRLPVAFGHGTMVAGIVHLVAPNAQIMPLKAFTGSGSAKLSDIIRAIYFATDNGAHVINMSFDIGSPSVELTKAINYATRNGVVCVASVGNSGAETLAFPAGLRNVIGVASTDANDVRSIFSNYGSALTILTAPGEGVITVYPGGYYAVVSGTSFAAPFVSGGTALLVQYDLNLDFDDAVHALSNAKKLNVDLGFGRLDLFQAVRSTLNH